MPMVYGRLLAGSALFNKRVLLLILALSGVSSVLLSGQDIGALFTVGKHPDTTVYPSGGPPAGCTAGTSAAVIPCAFGTGMNTRAAYGAGSNPTVYRVTTLVDDSTNTTNGDGTHNSSLRAALEASGPRVVVFERSGTVVLQGDINVFNPYLTIAGQTSPSPGITIRGVSDTSQVSAGGIAIRTHDVLVQHIRVRIGDGGTRIPQTQANDSLAVYGASTRDTSVSDVYNIVIDHCSMSWAGDKDSVFIFLPTDAGITYWWNIISEALYRSKNVILGTTSAPSSLGVGIFQNYTNLTARGTFIGNLMAHNSGRNPEIQGPVDVHVINNVIYDWGKDVTAYQWATFLYSEDASVGPMHVNVIGNKYIAGPTPAPFTPLVAIGTFGIQSGTQLYMSDNTLDQTRQAITLYTHGSTDAQVGSPAVSLSGITVLPSSGIEALVLAHAGARPADRDSVDTRIITEVTDRTGSTGTSCPGITLAPDGITVTAISGRICSQTDVGGWPSLATNTRAFTLPATPHHVNASGYTDLEVVLHTAATAIE